MLVFALMTLAVWDSLNWMAGAISSLPVPLKELVQCGRMVTLRRIRGNRKGAENQGANELPYCDPGSRPESISMPSVSKPS